MTVDDIPGTTAEQVKVIVQGHTLLRISGSGGEGETGDAPIGRSGCVRLTTLNTSGHDSPPVSAFTGSVVLQVQHLLGKGSYLHRDT